jgi:hypothetical protein
MGLMKTKYYKDIDIANIPADELSNISEFIQEHKESISEYLKPDKISKTGFKNRSSPPTTRIALMIEDVRHVFDYKTFKENFSLE